MKGEEIRKVGKRRKRLGKRRKRLGNGCKIGHTIQEIRVEIRNIETVGGNVKIKIRVKSGKGT